MSQIFIVHSEPLVQTGIRLKEIIFFSGLSADVQSLLAMITRKNFLYTVLICHLGLTKPVKQIQLSGGNKSKQNFSL